MTPQAPRHIDYLQKFANIQLPVIPATASFLDKQNRQRKGGKTPGEFANNYWFASRWGDLGVISRRQALKWDNDGAGIGLRLGLDGHHGLDVDITDAGLAGSVRRYLEPLLPMIRGVDHPEHHKFLCLLKLADPDSTEDINLRKWIITFTQPDGEPGKIELLGTGQYCNADGLHQDRLTPYVWNLHPLDHEVPVLSLEAFDAIRREISDILTLAGASQIRLGAASGTSTATPEISQNRVGEADLTTLLGMIDNDERFVDRKAWMAIFHAIWVASGGLPYGREAWLVWCDSIEQGDPEEPERVWDAGVSNPTSPGLSKLLDWAEQTGDPDEFRAFTLKLARQDFDDYAVQSELEPLASGQSILDRLERDWVYVAGEQRFYHIPSGIDVAPTGWAGALGSDVPLIRLAWGARAGKDKDKPAKGSLLMLFRRHHPGSFAHKVVNAPGEPLLFTRDGVIFLNLWHPLPRPHRDKPVTQAVIDRYVAHCAFVLGSMEAAQRWLKWHAFLLQHPGEQPGWHWIIMGKQGLGKDRMAMPFALAHDRNDGFKPLMASSLKSSFNEYAAKRFIIISELRQMSGAHDAYNELKAVTSQSGKISINPKGKKEYTAINVAGLVMFSNEPTPIYVEPGDRRFYVLNSLEVKFKDESYYQDLNTLVTEHADEITEYCYRMQLTAADYALLRGRAPTTIAKTDLADATMASPEHALRSIRDDLASGAGVAYRPVFTATDILAWTRDAGTPVPAVPRYGALYAAGFRPLIPEKDNPKQAAVTSKNKKLWRVQKWRDASGKLWNLNKVRNLKWLYRLYEGKPVGPVVVDDEADEADTL